MNFLWKCTNCTMSGQSCLVQQPASCRKDVLFQQVSIIHTWYYYLPTPYFFYGLLLYPKTSSSQLFSSLLTLPTYFHQTDLICYKTDVTGALAIGQGKCSNPRHLPCKFNSISDLQLQYIYEIPHFYFYIFIINTKN